jgi:hypothetical protein
MDARELAKRKGIVMIELISYLTRTRPGVVGETDVLENLLAESWDQLDGSCDRRMEGYKLLGRMEHVQWRPPVLSFCVERHLACGSTRAVLQHWAVDLHHNSAMITKTEDRKLYPLSLGLSAEKAGEEIARAILGGKDDERLHWEDDGTACVVASWVFPKETGFRFTVGARRRALCNCIADVVAEHGWKKCGQNRFRRKETTVEAEMSGGLSGECSELL